MNNYEEEEFYRQKYLKYKAKYLEAKNELEGGIGESVTASKCGKYVYFLRIPKLDEEMKIEDRVILNKKIKEELETQLNQEIKNENKGYKVDKLVATLVNKNEYKYTGAKKGENTIASVAYIEIKDFINQADLTQIIGMKEYKKLTDGSFFYLGIDTKGAVDENGIIMDTKKLQEQVHKLFPFHYYFVKKYTCSTGFKNFMFGKKGVSNIVLNEYTK
jgi:hypothetical protein